VRSSSVYALLIIVLHASAIGVTVSTQVLAGGGA